MKKRKLIPVCCNMRMSQIKRNRKNFYRCRVCGEKKEKNGNK